MMLKVNVIDILHTRLNYLLTQLNKILLVRNSEINIVQIGQLHLLAVVLVAMMVLEHWLNTNTSNQLVRFKK